MKAEEVKVYKNHYIIHADGRVYSEKIKRYQKPRVHTNGYLRATINGKDKYIHRLVAKCFLEKKKGMNEVNHKDGDKTNNHVSNLEWSNRQKNNQHAFDIGLRTREEMVEMSNSKKAVKARAKRRLFNKEQIIGIMRLKQEGYSDTEIARKYGCSRGAIWGIVNKKSYKEIKR